VGVLLTTLLENINGTRKVFVGRSEFLLDWGVFPFSFYLFVPVIVLVCCRKFSGGHHSISSFGWGSGGALLQAGPHE